MRMLFLAAAYVVAAADSHAQVADQNAVAAISVADNDWNQAYALAAGADPVATDLLTWMRLRQGAGRFAEYQGFSAAHPDWPGLDRLRSAGESEITKGSDPAQVIAYFAQTAPQTGTGAVRLAQALIATGDEAAAVAVLRQAWVALSLSEAGQAVMLTAFGATLAPFHTARVDALLWRSRISDAQRMIPLLDADWQALTRARIGYERRAPNLQALYDAVPAPLQDNPGLIYARFNWLIARGKTEEATQVLRGRSTSAASLGQPFRWSGWRRVLARTEMREGRADQAYALASQHYLTEGASYADLEWLSGYIALTYLGDPVGALAHFENGAAAVETPISVGRMHYWAGRAHDAMGAPELGAISYGIAAEHQTGFYGLLAAERVGRTLDPIWAQNPIVPLTDVFERDITKAAFFLLAAGERGQAVTFFAHLGSTLEPGALAQVGAALDALGEQYYTLVLGKRAATRGVIVPQNYFPIHGLAQMDLPIDPAFALSIARRESEFNASVGSPVGALGLMQLMPATAQEVAGFLDLPYSRNRLTADWAYNATLGSQYLSNLQDEFGPTPVMIAAGYNAGPSRPKTWMDARGDPRLREIDVVDWIEHIPFRETRNYVMRVTESIPIYQARLTGQAGSVAFMDLLIGVKPLLRPRMRPAQANVDTVPNVRPILRP